MRAFLGWLILAALLWVLFFIFAMSSHSSAQTLTCTIPRFGQHRWIDPSQGSDSIMVECQGPDTTFVDSLLLYRYQNGAFQLYRTYYVRGREGQSFTSDSLPPGQYTMIAKNQWGKSCGGNVATIPGTVTGVPTGEVKTPANSPVLGRLYDVRGRLVQGRPAAGIYFTENKKRVVINSRGEVISR